MGKIGSICEEERCDDFDRVKFFNGQLLTAQDFDLQTQYFKKLNKEQNTYLHDDGVIRGLRVKAINPAGWQVIVEKGVAVDCIGNMMHVESEQVVNLEEIVGSVDPSDGIREFVICIKYREVEGCPVLRTGSHGFCGGGEHENSRIKEGYTLEVYEKKRFIKLFPCLRMLTYSPLFPLFEKKSDTALTKNIQEASTTYTAMENAYVSGNLNVVAELMTRFAVLERSCEETLHRNMTDLTLQPLPSCSEPHCLPIASVRVGQEDSAITNRMINLYTRKLAVSTRLIFDLLVSSICAMKKTDVRIVPSYRDISTTIASGITSAVSVPAVYPFFASIKNVANKEVEWSVDSQGLGVNVGTIDQNGIYSPPKSGTIPEKVTVRAVSKEEKSAFDTAIIKIK